MIFIIEQTILLCLFPICRKRLQKSRFDMFRCIYLDVYFPLKKISINRIKSAKNQIGSVEIFCTYFVQNLN